MIALVNGTVLTPFRSIGDGVVLVEGETIREAGARGAVAIPAGAEVVDAGGAWIIPGFIETHTHGAGGFDVMDGAEAVRGVARTVAPRGVTSFLPTTLSASWAAVEAAVMGIEEAARSRSGGARVLGAHLEGPYCNPLHCGALNPKYLIPPKREQYVPLLDRAPHVRRISAAPEMPGALDLARELRARGIVASVAHSDATYQQVAAAVEAGFTHSTHLYSAMSTVHRDRGYRIAGALEAVLVFDELATELIADGHHLPPSLLKLAIKAKGVDKICVITDSMPAAGLGPGKYKLGDLDVIVESSVPETFEVPPDERSLVAKLTDRSCFAGSVATMDQVVRNMVRLAGLGLPEAVRMATATPARIHGIKDRGVLAPGKKADLVILEDAVVPRLTMVEGEVVYRA